MTHDAKLRIGFLGFAAPVLLAPLLAMQITDEVNWAPGDFLVAGVMLASVALGFELAMRVLRKPLHRWVAMVGVTLLALLVWAELAVGVLG